MRGRFRAEVQWKVFTQLGLNDSEIRSWFNGPALLTWSRGQNEYGAGIAGPLPRSVRRRNHFRPQLSDGCEFHPETI